MQELNDHIDKNIKALPTEGGFKVPAGYFDDLKVLIHYQTVYAHQQAQSTENLEDYFTTSRKQILSKTTRHNSRSAVLLVQFTKYLSVAASLLVVVGALFWMYQPSQKSTPSHHLSDEEIIGYLQQDPTGELQIDEVVNAIPVHALPVETNEEDYLMIETL